MTEVLGTIMTLLDLYFANITTEVNIGFNAAKHKSIIKKLVSFESI